MTVEDFTGPSAESLSPSAILYQRKRRCYLIAAFSLQCVLVLFILIYFSPIVFELCEGKSPQLNVKGPFTIEGSNSDTHYGNHKFKFTQTEFNGNQFQAKMELEVPPLLGVIYYVFGGIDDINEGDVSLYLYSNSSCLVVSSSLVSEEPTYSPCNDNTTMKFSSWYFNDSKEFYVFIIPSEYGDYSLVTNLWVYVSVVAESIIILPSPVYLFLFSAVGIIVVLICFFTSIVLQRFSANYQHLYSTSMINTEPPCARDLM